MKKFITEDKEFVKALISNNITKEEHKLKLQRMLDLVDKIEKK